MNSSRIFIWISTLKLQLTYDAQTESASTILLWMHNEKRRTVSDINAQISLDKHAHKNRFQKWKKKNNTTDM